MSGPCSICHAKTMTVAGSRNEHARAIPPDGYRLGYRKESAEGTELICVICFVSSLPSNITA